ncbi:MAG: UvrD-helicase domain-containing protein [Lachnospiraceae bacterium]|nr:UvrD-helicase domain-containing protein [Lachnospiraceae bacterium]
MENQTLEGLNSAQLEAVTTTEGFVRVIAGAGSGKTRALSRRFAYLVNDLGIMPGNILCVTFTNKAANEMRERIHRLTGDRDTGYVNTFHGFCVSVLQEDSHCVQYPKSFLVLDNSDIDSMLKVIYEERSLTLRDMTFAQARDMIEMQKTMQRPDYYKDMITMSLDVLYQKYVGAQKPADIIFYGYLYQEKKCFGLDYNDLIKFTLYVFEKYPDVRLKWQKRLEYIMIDEFQDIDPLQYELMEVLCAYHRNLFIVGDPDQTIYTWRGASVRFLMEFDEHFPGTKTIMMMQNYRSTPQIIRAVNSLIDKNRYRIKKDLEPVKGDGKNVLCHYARSPQAEAEWIADRIRELEHEGRSLNDIAILYRAHYVTRSIEDVFVKKEIPYTIYSGVPFYGRMEIKDALSYLRMIVYQDDLSFLRIANVPKRNIGKQRIQMLTEYAAANGCSLYTALKKNLNDSLFICTGAKEFISLIDRFAATYEKQPISELLASVLDQSGYEKMLRTEGSQERLDNLAELKQSVFEYETTCGEEGTLEQYVRYVALATNTDTAETSGKVKMMTIHSAKGLEFPCVFLCGLNEGILPSRKVRTLQAMEEERRLSFVAMTRAEERLFLSEAEGRGFDGSPRYPSRFLLDIDSSLLEVTDPPREELIQEVRSYLNLHDRHYLKDEEQKIFPAGSRVRHSVFGEGTITGADMEAAAYRIQFDRMGTERSIAFRIPLELLS